MSDTTNPFAEHITNELKLGDAARPEMKRCSVCGAGINDGKCLSCGQPETVLTPEQIADKYEQGWFLDTGEHIILIIPENCVAAIREALAALAQIEAEVGAKALEDAADAVYTEPMGEQALEQWLRDRAAALRATATPAPPAAAGTPTAQDPSPDTRQ